MSMPTEQMERPPAPVGNNEVASFSRVLKNRNFLLLWLAQLISLTVLNAANFGLVALVNKLPNGAFLSSLAIIAFTLPAVPFSAVAGVIVDRLNKQYVMWVSNFLRLLTMLFMFAWLLHDHTDVWPLFGLMFLTSLIGQFFIPAEGAAIPLLVGERELMPALSLFNITVTLSQAVGFLILGSLVARLFPSFTLHAGVLVLDVHSNDMLFVIAAFFYAVCVVLILLIPAHAFAEPHLRKQGERNTYAEVGVAIESIWRDMVGGWHIVRADRLLFFSVIQLSVVGIIMQLIAALAGTFVKIILHRPPEDMPIVLAPAAIGLVGASILMPRITERVGKLRLGVIGLIILAVGFALLPVAHWIALYFDPINGTSSPLLLLAVIVLVFLLGVAMACVNIPTQTLMQQRSPEVGRARVLSLQFMIYSAGTIPVLLFAGAVAALFGFSQIVMIVSASILLFCWWGTRYVKNYEEKPERYESGEEHTPLNSPHHH